VWLLGYSYPLRQRLRVRRQGVAGLDCRRCGAETAYIEPGSLRKKGYIEGFDASLRSELPNGEIFYTLREAKIVIESWRRQYDTIRPDASLDYKPPASEIFVSAFAAWPAALEVDQLRRVRWRKRQP
jgi:Integrase core domain